VLQSHAVLFVAFVAAALSAGCDVAARPAAETQQSLVWRSVGTWSGRTSMQTESFLNESGSLRIRWETRNEVAGTDGTFRATFHSAVSGRPLTSFVGGRGTARGIAMITEDPRPTYVVVESNGVEWNFTLEEGFAARSSDTEPR
jgi:hypothetical protein